MGMVGGEKLWAIAMIFDGISVRFFRPVCVGRGVVSMAFSCQPKMPFQPDLLLTSAEVSFL